MTDTEQMRANSTRWPSRCDTACDHRHRRSAEQGIMELFEDVVGATQQRVLDQYKRAKK